MVKLFRRKKKKKGQTDTGVQAVLAPGVGDFIFKMQQIINDTTYLMEDNQAMTEYLANKVKLITDTVEDQDKTITELNDQKSKYKDKLIQKTLQADELEKDANSMKKHVAKLEETVHERTQEQEDAEQEISWLIEERDSSNKKVENLTAGIDRLQHNMDCLSKEHDKYEWKLQQMLLNTEQRHRREVHCLLNVIARLRVENHALKQKKLTAANITDMHGLMATTEAYVHLAAEKDILHEKLVNLASEKLELRFALRRLRAKFDSLTNSVAVHELAGCKASISERELEKMKMVQRSLCVQVNPEDFNQEEGFKSERELQKTGEREDSIGSQDSLASVSPLSSPRRSRTKLAKVPLDLRMSGLLQNISRKNQANITPDLSPDTDADKQDYDSSALSDSSMTSCKEENGFFTSTENETQDSDVKKGKV